MRRADAGYPRTRSLPSLAAPVALRSRVRLALLPGIALVAALAASEAAATPASERPYSHPRYFVGMSGLLSVPTDGDLDPGGGVKLRGGMRVAPRLAFEMDFDYNPAWDRDGGGRSWAFGFSGNGRVYLLKARIQPFLIGGVGGIRTATRGVGDTDPKFSASVRGGAGVDVYTSTTIAVSLDAVYVRPLGSRDDFAYAAFGVGIQWH